MRIKTSMGGVLMSLMQKRKGQRYERAVAKVLGAIWPTAERGIGQARRAGQCADVEGTPFWVEVKDRIKVNVHAAYRQAAEATDGRPPLVISKVIRGHTLVTVGLSDWLELVEGLREYGRHDVGCPGWYRARPEPEQHGLTKEALAAPCDCGLDAALGGPAKESR